MKRQRATINNEALFVSFSSSLVYDCHRAKSIYDWKLCCLVMLHGAQTQAESSSSNRNCEGILVVSETRANKYGDRHTLHYLCLPSLQCRTMDHEEQPANMYLVVVRDIYLAQHIYEAIEIRYGQAHVVGNLQQLLAWKHCCAFLSCSLGQGCHKRADLHTDRKEMAQEYMQ